MPCVRARPFQKWRPFLVHWTQFLLELGLFLSKITQVLSSAHVTKKTCIAQSTVVSETIRPSRRVPRQTLKVILRKISVAVFRKISTTKLRDAPHHESGFILNVFVRHCMRMSRNQQ
ncbi:uncharacterized protein [Asterias amurensis]|uniref:uncharacterized protein n=1 Tax=Asterias amurensis TaxID=7602 RepID=UPI003AB61C0F